MDFNTGTGGSSPDSPRVTGASGGSFGFDLSNPVGSFIGTIRALIFSPVAFFQGMPRTGGAVNPLAFAVICSLITAIPAALLVILVGLATGASGDAASALGLFVGAFLALILFPIGTLLGIFIASAVYHLLVLLFARPSSAGFGATLSVVSYSTFPNILGFLGVIPILGVLVSLALGIYVVVLNILGIREAHRTTSGKAALVVIIPIVVVFLLAIVLSVIVAIMASAAGQGM